MASEPPRAVPWTPVAGSEETPPAKEAPPPEEEPVVKQHEGPEFRGDDAGNAQARIVDGVLEVKLPFRLACRGGKADVAVNGRHHPVPVPVGAAEGDAIEVNGVRIRFVVAPDRVFRREGRDLVLTVMVEPGHAARGVEATVPTLDGPVRLKIPKGVRSGQRLRLRGKGVPFVDMPGDLFVEISVLPPEAGRVKGVGFSPQG
jgi:curved DNA-binding protein